jgi:hypothetical protein
MFCLGAAETLLLHTYMLRNKPKNTAGADKAGEMAGCGVLLWLLALVSCSRVCNRMEGWVCGQGHRPCLGVYQQFDFFGMCIAETVLAACFNKCAIMALCRTTLWVRS